MSDDILTRLRGVLNAFTVEEQQDTIDAAADKIEWLSRAGDALVAVLDDIGVSSTPQVFPAVQSWEEARRG